jgi:hypothetical protein
MTPGAVNVEEMGKQETRGNLVRSTPGERSLGRQRRRQGSNIKMDITEIGCECANKMN